MLKHSVDKTVQFLPDDLFVGSYEGLDAHLQKNEAYQKDIILFPKLTVTGTRSLQYVQQILAQTNDRFIRIQAYLTMQANRSYSLGCPKNLPNASKIWLWVGLGQVGEFFGSMDVGVIQNYDKNFASELKKRQKLEKDAQLRDEAIALYRLNREFVPERKARKALETAENERIEIESRLVSLIGLLSLRKQRQEAYIQLLARQDLSWSEKARISEKLQNERMTTEMWSQLKHALGTYRGNDFLDIALTQAWDAARQLVSVRSEAEDRVMSQEQNLAKVLLQKKAFVEKYCSDLVDSADPQNLETEKP